MKKLLFALLLLIPTLVLASPSPNEELFINAARRDFGLPELQGGGYGSIPLYNGTGAPSGGCQNGALYTRNSNGDFYTCNAGSWIKAGGGGGGTVTSIATTSPIAGGTITGTGTITCGTCVVASSPGIGLAHFAGSTQTVTSSLIVAADITSGTITGTQIASSTTLTTPNIGVATGTSLLATGIVDGEAPVIVTTGTSGSPGATYNHSYSFNEEGTAGTGVTYTLPTAAAGKQYCVANANGGAANTGILTVATSASGQFIIFTDGTLSATGGNVTSGGAAGDASCYVGLDATHWYMYVQAGVWTKH